MSALTIISIVIILIAIIIFVVLTFVIARKNYITSHSARLIPFSAVVGANGQDTNFTSTNSQGEVVNQITCPTGYKVNIVGAISQVMDPFGECTTSPSDSFKVSCGYSGTSSIPVPYESTSWTCSTSAQCGANPSTGVGIFECGPNGGCQLQSFDPNPLPSGSTYDGLCAARQGNLVGSYACIDSSNGGPCNGNTSQAVCIDKNICYGVTYNGSDSSLPSGTNIPMNPAGNPICVPGGIGNCAVRDVSAYIASKCDGSATCALSTADCGPRPCDLPTVNCGLNLGSSTGSGEQDFTANRFGSGYCSLPFAYGYPGGPALGVQQFQNTPASVSLGYQIHGIYTCVPENA